MPLFSMDDVYKIESSFCSWLQNLPVRSDEMNLSDSEQSTRADKTKFVGFTPPTSLTSKTAGVIMT